MAVLSNSSMAVTLLMCATLFVYFVAFVVRGGKPRVIPTIALGGAAVLIFLFREEVTRLLLFSIPVLVYVALFVVFGRTLVGGREPLIAQISRRERGGVLPPELVKYTRNVTWVWTAYFAGAAILSVLLARYSTLATWSAFANVLSWMALALLFFGEYVYRLLRFPTLPHSSPLKVMRRLLCDGLPANAPGHNK